MATTPTRTLPIILEDTYVRQDDQGRYSLNDLHQAAGGENRHRPSIWVENKQTKALITELETTQNLGSFPGAEILASKAGIPALVSDHGGARPGTYVARELVYAYAMWISPTFHLKVIRTFDALVTGKLGPATQANAMVGKATGLPLAQITGLQDQVHKLITRLKGETGAELRGVYYRQLQAVCTDLGQDPPPLAAMGSEAPAQPEAATQFWAVYQALQAAGVQVNHSRNPSVIAINLKQFAQVAAAHGMRLTPGPVLKDALRLSRTPRFVDVRTVNSAVLGNTIHCWTFQVDTTRAAAWLLNAA